MGWILAFIAISAALSSIAAFTEIPDRQQIRVVSTRRRGVRARGSRD
jgi:hypothetical protein